MTFGNRAFGVMAWMVPVFESLTTFGGVNGLLYSSDMLFLSGHERDIFPISLLWLTWDGPHRCQHFCAHRFLSLLYLISDDVWVLINYFSFVQWLSTGRSVLDLIGLIYQHYKKPDLPCPTKFHLIVPITFLLICAFLLIVPFYEKPYDTGVGLVIVLSGIPVYWMGVLWKNKPKSIQRSIDQLTILGQIILECTP